MRCDIASALEGEVSDEVAAEDHVFASDCSRCQGRRTRASIHDATHTTEVADGVAEAVEVQLGAVVNIHHVCRCELGDGIRKNVVRAEFECSYATVVAADLDGADIVRRVRQDAQRATLNDERASVGR